MKETIMKNLVYLCENILTKHEPSDFIMKRINKGEMMITQESLISSFYFILDGRLKVTANYENGKSILMSFINGFYILGDIEYITKDTATCDVQTMTELTYVEITYDTVREYYSTSHEFQSFLLQYISKKLLQTSNRLQFFNVYPLSARLCSYLYTISDYGHDRSITLPNLQDLSNNLCTSYRHLQRVFRELTAENVIKKTLHEVTIINPTKLKELSRGNIYEEQYFEKER